MEGEYNASKNDTRMNVLKFASILCVKRNVAV